MPLIVDELYTKSVSVARAWVELWFFRCSRDMFKNMEYNIRHFANAWHDLLTLQFTVLIAHMSWHWFVIKLINESILVSEDQLPISLIRSFNKWKLKTICIDRSGTINRYFSLWMQKKVEGKYKAGAHLQAGSTAQIIFHCLPLATSSERGDGLALKNALRCAVLRQVYAGSNYLGNVT